MTQTVNKQIEEDKRARGWQKDINFYGSTGVKVGAIMVGGPVGMGYCWCSLWLTTLLADSAGQQVVDAGLGLAKGVAKGLVAECSAAISISVSKALQCRWEVAH
ncbi:MAG: hypothetical protein IPP57_00335 [Candidatus Obscuribacter sp.]|nr:hypothetical protein [Candidatus Obscuribacter sp.]